MIMLLSRLYELLHESEALASALPVAYLATDASPRDSLPSPFAPLHTDGRGVSISNPEKCTLSEEGGLQSQMSIHDTTRSLEDLTRERAFQAETPCSQSA